MDAQNVDFRKSSRSGAQGGECVEVGVLEDNKSA